tara:strand:+ start:600 stop:950 length:351 start_codon:yes stop_codon:yes gene_type:complete
VKRVAVQGCTLAPSSPAITGTASGIWPGAAQIIANAGTTAAPGNVRQPRRSPANAPPQPPSGFGGQLKCLWHRHIIRQNDRARRNDGFAQPVAFFYHGAAHAGDPAPQRRQRTVDR